MNKVLKEIGSRVRKTRKDQHLSQSELAELMNVSASYISDLENRKINFSIESFIKLTEALQVSADWLLQTSIPEVTAIHSNELNELLSDCSSSESQMQLLKIYMTNTVFTYWTID